MKIFVVRHGKAGRRDRWTAPDRIRPLTLSGARQAEGLVELLCKEGIERILSSPYVRCVQTVQPLASRCGVTIEHSDALAEGAPLNDTLRLIEKVADRPSALCTHADIIENLMGYLESLGVRGADAASGKKGSTWVLTLDGGEFRKAWYLPPRA